MKRVAKKLATGVSSKWFVLAAALVGLAPGIALGQLTCPAPTQTQACRLAAFEYFLATDPHPGLLKKEIIEPDNPNLCVETEYDYDDFGNKKKATTRNCAGASGSAIFTARENNSYFDGTVSINTTPPENYTYPTGQFPVRVTNALNHEEKKAFDARFGTVTRLQGPNVLVTTWTYDGFGRRTLETRADGTKTEWAYLYCTGVGTPSVSCPPANAKYLVQTTPKDSNGVQSGPISKVYYDALNREIRTETEGFAAGTLALKDTEYDELGRVKRVSQPYFSGPKWTCFTYDELNRVLTERRPTDTNDNASCNSPAVTTFGYNGLVTTVTNALGNTETRHKNSQGQLIKVTRP